MDARVTQGVSGAVGGGLVGALTGFLVDKGEGDKSKARYSLWFAGAGAVAGAFLGVANASSGSTAPVAGTGVLPGGVGRLLGLGGTPQKPRPASFRGAALNDQLMPAAR
jgi:hypothetical protein